MGLKLIISIVIGLIVGYFILFQVDPWVINKCMTLANPPANISGIIELALWIILVIFSLSFTIGISVLCSTLVFIILGGR